MGLNWLFCFSAALRDNTKTFRFFFFGDGATRGLNVRDGSFRSELFLPREQTFTWHITQAATVPRVCAARPPGGETPRRRGPQMVEIARARRPLIAVIKGAAGGWTSRSWLFIHAEHVWPLPQEARRVVERSHCTYNGSLSTWFYHDVGHWWWWWWWGELHTAGSFFTIKARPMCSPSSQMKLIWADFSAKRSTSVSDSQHIDPKGGKILSRGFVFTCGLSNPRKEVVAAWSRRRRVTCVSCVRDGPVMSTRSLYFMYIFTHTHTHTCTWNTLTRARTSWQHRPPSATQTLSGGV